MPFSLYGSITPNAPFKLCRKHRYITCSITRKRGLICCPTYSLKRVDDVGVNRKPIVRLTKKVRFKYRTENADIFVNNFCQVVRFLPHDLRDLKVVS